MGFNGRSHAHREETAAAKTEAAVRGSKGEHRDDDRNDRSTQWNVKLSIFQSPFSPVRLLLAIIHN